MSAPLCACAPPAPCAQLRATTVANSGRPFWGCAAGACRTFAWADEKRTVLTEAGPLCDCRVATTRAVSQSALNPGRPFWRCANTGRGGGCRTFVSWAGPPLPPSPARPAAAPAREGCCEKCGQPVEDAVVGPHNTKGNAGRKYHRCAACAHWKWLSPEPLAPPPTPETPGSSEYVVSEETRRLLQALFDVPAGAGLGIGRDASTAQAPYDHLAVECAWLVQNPLRRKRYEDFRAAALAAAVASGAAPPPVELRAEHAAAARAARE